MQLTPIIVFVVFFIGTVGNAQSTSSTTSERMILDHPADEVGDFEHIRPKAIYQYPSSTTSVKGKLIGKLIKDENKTPIEKLVWGNFAPYMGDLQHRIKEHWFPPKGEETKRVVVLFNIRKGGNLSQLRLLKSSGVVATDDAALKAVKDSAPFHPLPSSCKDKSVDIQFTFDYNVFLSSNSR